MRKILSVLFLALVLAFASGGFALAQGVGAGIVGPPTTCTLSSCNTNGNYQINGLNALTSLYTNVGGVQKLNGLFIGANAGATAPTVIQYGTIGIGPGAMQSLTGSGTESVAIGPISMQFFTNGFGNTAVGEHTIGFDLTPSYVSAFGNDTMRDTIGNGGSTAFGAQSQDDGVGNTNTSHGAFALRGNAGSVVVTGTPHTGDVLGIPLTTTSINTTVLPATASYTVQAGDTLTSIAMGLASAIDALGAIWYPDTVGSVNGVGIAATTPPFVGTGTVYLHFPGGTASGAEVTIGTPTCTGTCSETLTPNAPFSGTDNLADGYQALYGASLTTGNLNDARGDYALQQLGGASVGVMCYGFECGQNAATGVHSVIIGQQSARVATDLTGETIIGGNAAGALTTGQYDLCIGYLSCVALTTGGHNVLIGSAGGVTLATGSDNILIGAGNNVDTPGAASSFEINIGNSIAGTTNNWTSPTVCAVGMQCILGVLKGANLNATTDQAIVIGPRTSTQPHYLASVTKYIVTAVWLDNCSTSITTAAGGVYTTTSKGGTPVVPAAQTYTSCTSSTTMQQTVLNTGTGSPAATTYTAATLYLSLTSPQGGTATGDVYVLGIPFN